MYHLAVEAIVAPAGRWYRWASVPGHVIGAKVASCAGAHCAIACCVPTGLRTRSWYSKLLLGEHCHHQMVPLSIAVCMVNKLVVAAPTVLSIDVDDAPYHCMTQKPL